MQSEFLPVTQEALDTQFGISASRPNKFKVDNSFPLIEFNRDHARDTHSARGHRETKNIKIKEYHKAKMRLQSPE